MTANFACNASANAGWKESNILFKEYTVIADEINDAMKKHLRQEDRIAFIRDIQTQKIGEIDFSDSRVLPQTLRDLISKEHLTKIENCIVLSEFVRVTGIPGIRAEQMFSGMFVYKLTPYNKPKRKLPVTKKGNKRKDTLRNGSVIAKLHKCIRDAFEDNLSLYYLGTETLKKSKKPFKIEEEEKQHFDKIIKISNIISQRSFYFGAW